MRNKDILANNILNSLSESGQQVRKYYQRRLPSDTSQDYYYIIRNTPNAETVIVEYGFLDNTIDANRLKNNYEEYAEAVVKAVLDYKNIPYNETGYYIVKKGDSLWSIASLNNTTVTKLKELNKLTTNTLSIGQKLKLPETELVDIVIPNTDAQTYTVQKGDSLYSIATKYDTTVDTLKNINNLTTNTLSIGQVLILPETETSKTYIVQKGDTLYSIANKNNISVNKLKEINNLITNTLSIGQTLKLSEDTVDITTTDYDYYTVKKGDTLYSISQKYNINIDDLKNLNNLTTNTLSIGQLIKIPNTLDTTYIVKKGDTLWSIAKDNNISVDTLKSINNLTTNTLSIGQQLLIAN